ncbi:MAG: hypothetical protein LUI09_07135 [Prevotellaceae bacterium]|nr:hypothetical protein [Prevotellaceae bacterium]
MRNAVFIDELPNQKGNGKFNSYRYYVCGLRIGGEDYTVKMVVGVRNGKKYYDHSLTGIEKGRLLDLTGGAASAEGFKATADKSPSYAPDKHKDTRLFNILQANHSKVVDENGEPKVVYHGSRSGGGFNEFEGETFFTDNRDVAEMFRQEAAYSLKVNGEDAGLLFEQDAQELAEYLTGGDYNAEDIGGWGEVAPGPLMEETDDYYRKKLNAFMRDYLGIDGDVRTLELTPSAPVFEVFLDIKNPEESDFGNEVWTTDNAPERGSGGAEKSGRDGMIIRNIVEGGLAAELPNGEEVPPATDYIVFKPEQIKSVENNGDFSRKTGDIRFRETDADAVADAQDVSIVEAVDDLSHSLGVDVDIVSDPSEVTDPEARRAIEQGRHVTGWYDRRTGRVVLYLPNVQDTEAAERTVLHEVVGHKGLRSLIGESRYDAMMRSLMKELPQERRQRLEERAKAKGWSEAEAMDEYLAERAELGKKPTWWGKVVSAVREALRAMGLDLRLTDADIDWMLHRSRMRLEGRNSLLDIAADAALRHIAERAWRRERTAEAMRTLEGVSGQKTPGQPAAALRDDQRLPSGTTSGYSSEQPAAAPQGGLRFGQGTLGKRRRAEMLATLNKRRQDMEDEEKEALLNVIAGTYERDGGAVAEAAFKWFTDGAVRLPEDMEKVRQAVQVAKKAGVDPASYKSPMDLINQHTEFSVTEERANPDSVPTLSNKRELANGITVYDVAESEESRQNMRKIINTHWGRDCSPWCLLQGDGEGNLTEQSAKYWRHYSNYPKRVAFKDGRLLAFFASDGEPTWWDRQDHPHNGLPVTKKMDDGSGRVATYGMDEKTGELGEPRDIHKGNRQNGEYEEWYDEKHIKERSHWKDGKKDGLYENWYKDGQPAYRMAYKDGKHDGLYERWHDNGQLISRGKYKDGKLDGLYEEWNANGQHL